MEYAGDLIDIGTAKDLEAKYSSGHQGCYMIIVDKQAVLLMLVKVGGWAYC